ncbi:protein NRT1/ PTR FAMILY 5.8 [Aegilops tauschii subsp. strangulata]|uniref:Peptide transporter PTR1 n=4 Tax=Aegilops tauschii subsp. strangulata TaxID=200361 RepID=A0A453R7P3_AEGTS|nr:protein NRT1/ PTR FAMILY 5.8 [Aegilops tauschii subsp. strangulata]
MTTEKGSSASLGRPCILIIVVAGVERFAFKGVASNMVNYLTGVVGMSTAAAAQSVSAWVGITSMLPLVSAVLADSYWDRYSTVTASSLLYVAGLAGLASWAMLHKWLPWATLFLPLYLISIGQGAYNPSLQAFGADQLDIGDEDEDGGGGGTAEEKGKVKSAFFQWWYFGICCGSLLGNTTMSYVQDTVGWGIGFAVPCAAMALSVAAFLCCTPLYKKISQPRSADRPCSESILRALKSLLASVSAGKIRLSSRHDGQDDGDGKNNASELELQEKPLKLAKLTDPKEANRPGVAKIILRLLPIWTVLLMFAVIFQQPMTFFTKQGTLMDHRVAGGAFVIPPATLQSTITVSIIILMPLYDRVIMPLIGAVTRNSKGITVLQRIGVGMVFSVVAMVVAAVVESRRRHEAAGQMSIAWLLPQYVLLGVSDVFAVVGMQEFFYSQVPDAMRTIGIGLYLSVFGVGSLVGTLLIAAIEVATAGGAGKGHGWFSDDPREERLDNYYWFLVLLSSVSFVIFTQLCRCYN